MQRHRTSKINRERQTSSIPMLAVLVAMAFVVVLFIHNSNTAFASQVGSGHPSQSLTKEAQLNQQIAAQQALARADGPKKHVTAHPTPIVYPRSCPIAAAQSGIFPYIGGAGGISDTIVNRARIGATQAHPFVYTIFAGAVRGDPEQGVLIVMRLPEDPCAADSVSTTPGYYDSPYQEGALTLTQIAGDTVTFTTSTGSTGHFDYVTGQFS